MKFIDKLKKHKIAWKAFELYLAQEDYNLNVAFTELKYEYQVGVFLRFFEHYGMTSNEYYGLYDLITTLDDWKKTIELGFDNLNKEIKDGTK